MIRRPPRSTRTDTLFPYTTLFRSTGEALLLNVPAGHPVSDKPLALLAPRLAAPVIEAARHGAAAKLALRGRGGIRAAQNIIGRRVRSGRPWLVVSTPRSGWTDCAGERGPGIAMWLALADWMPRALDRKSTRLNSSP